MFVTMLCLAHVLSGEFNLAVHNEHRDNVRLIGSYETIIGEVDTFCA